MPMPEEIQNLTEEQSDTREPVRQVDLESRVAELEKKLKQFEDHKHLGHDGSKEFGGETKLEGKYMVIHGAGSLQGDFGEFTLLPVVVTDGSKESVEAVRSSGFGIAVRGEKGGATEQTNAVLSTGKQFSDNRPVPSNKADWSKVNFAQFRVIQSPQSGPVSSGPSVLPPLSFLEAQRTPSVVATGTITNGGNTLADSTARLEANELAYSRVTIYGESGPLESRLCIGNSENVLQIQGEWETESGTYEYRIQAGVLLGTADVPFSRVYVGEDIRLGYGASSGTQVQYIKWGEGSPEGVVTANIGSMYLRRDGGANTTLYIKESGDGSSSGWSAK